MKKYIKIFLAKGYLCEYGWYSSSKSLFFLSITLADGIWISCSSRHCISWSIMSAFHLPGHICEAMWLILPLKEGDYLAWLKWYYFSLYDSRLIVCGRDNASKLRVAVRERYFRLTAHCWKKGERESSKRLRVCNLPDAAVLRLHIFGILSIVENYWTDSPRFTIAF